MTTNVLSPDEIHRFGIQIVRQELEQSGHEIVDVIGDPALQPQIVARDPRGRLLFIAVRTACYPERGTLDDTIAAGLIAHAKKFDALACLARVGIANAAAQSEAQRSIPVRGAPFETAYDGLEVVRSSCRVVLFDKPAERAGKPLVPGRPKGVH